MNIYQYKCHIHIHVNVCGPHLYNICLMYPLLTYLYIILFGYIVYILVHLFDVPTTSLLVYLFKVPIVYLLVHLFEVPPWFTYLYTCLRYPHCLLTCTPV